MLCFTSEFVLDEWTAAPGVCRNVCDYANDAIFMPTVDYLRPRLFLGSAMEAWLVKDAWLPLLFETPRRPVLFYYEPIVSPPGPS